MTRRAGWYPRASGDADHRHGVGDSKKATSLTTFTCEEGARLFAAVRETVATGEPAVARVETVGRMADGTEVSRFVFTWSFKKRAPRG